MASYQNVANAAVAHKRDRRRRPLEFSEFILRLGHSLSEDVDRFIDLVFRHDERRFETDDALLVEGVRRRHPELEALGYDDAAVSFIRELDTDDAAAAAHFGDDVGILCTQFVRTLHEIIAHLARSIDEFLIDEHFERGETGRACERIAAERACVHERRLTERAHPDIALRYGGADRDVTA